MSFPKCNPNLLVGTKCTTRSLFDTELVDYKKACDARQRTWWLDGDQHVIDTVKKHSNGKRWYGANKWCSAQSKYVDDFVWSMSVPHVAGCPMIERMSFAYCNLTVKVHLPPFNENRNRLLRMSPKQSKRSANGAWPPDIMYRLFDEVHFVNGSHRMWSSSGPANAFLCDVLRDHRVCASCRNFAENMHHVFLALLRRTQALAVNLILEELWRDYFLAPSTQCRCYAHFSPALRRLRSSLPWTFDVPLMGQFAFHCIAGQQFYSHQIQVKPTSSFRKVGVENEEEPREDETVVQGCAFEFTTFEKPLFSDVDKTMAEQWYTHFESKRIDVQFPQLPSPTSSKGRTVSISLDESLAQKGPSTCIVLLCNHLGNGCEFQFDTATLFLNDWYGYPSYTSEQMRMKTAEGVDAYVFPLNAFQDEQDIWDKRRLFPVEHEDWCVPGAYMNVSRLFKEAHLLLSDVRKKMSANDDASSEDIKKTDTISMEICTWTANLYRQGFMGSSVMFDW